jgi:hypothetical protein
VPEFPIVDLTAPPRPITARELYLVRGLLLAATEPATSATGTLTPDGLVAAAARFTTAASPPVTEAELGGMLQRILAADHGNPAEARS